VGWLKVILKRWWTKIKLVVGLVVLMLVVASCASGDGFVNLTRNSQVADTSPSWSPGGNKIVFTSFKASRPDGIPTIADYGIYVMDADGRNRTQVLALPSDVPANSPSWSPDGKRIVYASRSIVTMDLDGSNRRAVFLSTSVFDISDCLPTHLMGARLSLHCHLRQPRGGRYSSWISMGAISLN